MCIFFAGGGVDLAGGPVGFFVNGHEYHRLSKKYLYIYIYNHQQLLYNDVEYLHLTLWSKLISDMFCYD